VSLGVIVRKELRELLTLQTLMPVVIMSVLFGVLGNMMTGIEDTATERPTVAVIDQDGTALSSIAVEYIMGNAVVSYNGSSVQEGMDRLEAADGTALIIVPQGFEHAILHNTTGVLRIEWLMRGAGLLDSISTTPVEALLAGVDRQISTTLVSSTEINATIALSPTGRNETTVFKGKVMDGVSPGTVANMVSGQSLVVPLIIVMLITMSGGMVISSMGMEKETKTLETLLTMPIKRTYIVAGKLAGAAVVGFIMAGVYLVGFGYYMTSLSVSSLDPAKYGLTLGAVDYVLVGASLFLALLAGLALSMMLGTFAENFKAAQSLTFPIVSLALIPMFLTMFKDFDTMPLVVKVLVFAIPFSHPMMAIRALMFDDYTLVLAGIAYLALFNAVIIYLVARTFSTDRLLTGRKKRRSRSGWRRFVNLPGMR
jgi:ABC-2 type transport system permease protein